MAATDVAEIVVSLTTIDTDSGQISDSKSTVTRMEERYIQLLEEKIKRLEEDAQAAKSSSKATPLSPTGEEDKENDGEDKEKPKASRIRYVHRTKTLFSTDDKDLGVDEWNNAKSKDEHDTDAPVITWRRTQHRDGKAADNELLIESSILKDALSKIFGRGDGITFDTSEVAIDAPYSILYHNEDKLRKYAEDEANAAAKPEIELLLESLQREQKASRKDIDAYKKNDTITYEFLWAIFYPGCRVVQRVMGQPQLLVVLYALTREPYNGSEDVWEMDILGIDWNGEEFLPASRTVKIKRFNGPKAISELEVYPLKYWKSTRGDEPKTAAELEPWLEKRGQLFVDLCLAKLEKRHRPYGGMAITAGAIEMARDQGRDDTTVNSDEEPTETSGEQITLEDRSFVMIDHYAYLHLCRIQTTPLFIGKERVFWMEVYTKEWQERSRSLIGDLPDVVDGRLRRPLTLEQLQYCPPRVLGFAITQKIFVQLLVKNIGSEVSPENKQKPWNDLKLRKKDKETLKSLVTEHAKGEIIEDIIPGKGKGLVVLLHGPPGVGKTLSAESLAILTDKPLYSVSMADVGISPRTVEFNLQRIFALATHWKAILLFDEADVFLEARSLQDVRRNSLVSTLLRILEYFQGILFLTSNRVKTFDEAFTSRIHMAIQFVPLDPTQRSNIWKLWFNRIGDHIHPSFDWPDYLDEENGSGTLIKHKLNGREIRNIFRSAMNLAMADEKTGRKLTWQHVENVLQRTLDFKIYMLQGEEMAKRDNIR